MAQIIFDVPEEFVDRVVAALKDKYIELTLGGPDIKLTDLQMAKTAMMILIRQEVRNYEYREAIKSISIDVPDDIINTQS